VILADTSIWIDHLRGCKTDMPSFLSAGQIVMHPLVVAEIALGSLKHRKKTLTLLESLWQVKMAELDEVRRMIEAHHLYSKGLGVTDAHLAASCLLTSGIKLWTRDAALDRAAQSLGIRALIA
jgi:predicted nucleic acid-binding protein